MILPIRVLVTEDSVTVRKRLVEMIGADPELVVVGEAANGKQAIDLCQKLRPDVMSLDMMLPIMTGVAVTEYVMAYLPTPIVIVSASTNRGELLRTYDALAAGAVEVLEKPRGDGSDEAWARRYTELLKLVASIKVITHPRIRLGAWGRPAPNARETSGSTPAPGLYPSPSVLAIGGSTGAPGAMAEILRSLGPGFPLPMLIVLHISPAFATALPEWLEDQSGVKAAFAEDGQPLPPPGRVVLAPPDRHLVLQGGRLRLTQDAERHSCRPSVDALFESMASELGHASLACLLTGMGRDGAEGLLAIRRAGGFTVAQDEASSVVFGMPKEAILLGAAVRVLSLGEIGPVVSAMARGPGGGL
jgi:two-component system chemotaxis response regulator CheB